MAANSALVDFYGNGASDDKGRRLAHILSWPDDLLEYHHDFIQWLFPLPERSPVNPSAPLLDAAAVAEFRSNAEMQRNLRSAFSRMIRFYGLEESGVSIVKASNFKERSDNWLHVGNHNHLRIARILKCLRLTGLTAEAAAFYACLDQIRLEHPGAISSTSFRFWTGAAGDLIS